MPFNIADTNKQRLLLFFRCLLQLHKNPTLISACPISFESEMTDVRFDGGFGGARGFNKRQVEVIM